MNEININCPVCTARVKKPLKGFEINYKIRCITGETVECPHCESLFSITIDRIGLNNSWDNVIKEKKN